MYIGVCSFHKLSFIEDKLINFCGIGGNNKIKVNYIYVYSMCLFGGG